MTPITHTPASRRAFLGLGLGTLGLGALAACAPAGTPAPQSTPTFGADIRMLLFGTPERQAKVQQVLDLYVAEFGGSADAEAVANASYAEKLATTMAAGAAADVVALFHLAVADYARRNVLSDLDALGVVDTSAFDQAAIESGVIDGKRVALPMGDNAVAAFYDKTRVEAAGLTLLEPGHSWDDFIDFSNDLSRAEGDGYYGTVDGSGDYNLLEVYMRQQGLDMYNDSGDLGFTRKDLEKWFELWADLRDTGAAPPAGVSAEAGVGGFGTSLMVTGAASNFFIYGNVLGAFQGLTQNELVITTPPMRSAAKSGLFVRASNWIAGNSRGDNTDDGANFINFMLNNEEAAGVLGSEFGAPVNLDLRAAQTFEGPAKLFVDYVDLVSAEYATPVPSLAVEFPKGSPEIQAALVTASQAIASGQESISSGTDSFMTQSEGFLL